MSKMYIFKTDNEDISEIEEKTILTASKLDLENYEYYELDSKEYPFNVTIKNEEVVGVELEISQNKEGFIRRRGIFSSLNKEVLEASRIEEIERLKSEENLLNVDGLRGFMVSNEEDRDSVMKDLIKKYKRWKKMRQLNSLTSRIQTLYLEWGTCFNKKQSIKLLNDLFNNYHIEMEKIKGEE